MFSPLWCVPEYLSVLPAPVSSGTRPVWRYLPGWSLSSAGTQGGNYGHTVSNDDGSSLLEGGRQRCGHQGLNHHSSSLSHNPTRRFIKPRKTEALFLEETNFLKVILCHYSLKLFKNKIITLAKACYDDSLFMLDRYRAPNFVQRNSL